MHFLGLSRAPFPLAALEIDEELVARPLVGRNVVYHELEEGSNAKDVV